MGKEKLAPAVKVDADTTFAEKKDGILIIKNRGCPVCQTGIHEPLINFYGDIDAIHVKKAQKHLHWHSVNRLQLS